MVIWLERGADLHMAQWMPLPLTVSCFSKIQQLPAVTGFSFLVPAHLGSPGQRAIKRVCAIEMQFQTDPFVQCLVLLWIWNHFGQIDHSLGCESSNVEIECVDCEVVVLRAELDASVGRPAQIQFINTGYGSESEHRLVWSLAKMHTVIIFHNLMWECVT